MKPLEKEILEKFKSLLLKKLDVYQVIVFGSRARGEATEYSDLDVIVVLNTIASDADLDYVSECSWEAGFEPGIVLVPIVFTKEAWENSPERYSLLALAVEKEGVQI
jgi:predicted nucleotidyltransferase